MGTFDRQIAQAKRQLAKGELCTWTVPGAKVIADPTKPWIATAGQQTEYQVNILFTQKDNRPYAKESSDSNVAERDADAIMAAQTFTPSLNDKVTRSDGTVLAIDSLNPLAPNGQVILWKLVFKQ